MRIIENDINSRKAIIKDTRQAITNLLAAVYYLCSQIIFVGSGAYSILGF